MFCLSGPSCNSWEYSTCSYAMTIVLQSTRYGMLQEVCARSRKAVADSIRSRLRIFREISTSKSDCLEYNVMYSSSLQANLHPGQQKEANIRDYYRCLLLVRDTKAISAQGISHDTQPYIVP